MPLVSEKVVGGVATRWLRMRGYRGASLNIARQLLLKDWHYRKEISKELFPDAYRRGFSAVFYKNLTFGKIDPSLCLPDLWYAKAHPLNGQFGKWIDDKLTFKYILKPFDQFLPRYFFYLDKGECFPLMDFPPTLPANMNGVLALLQERKKLVLKQVAGSLSVGFHKLESAKDGMMLNGERVSEVQLTTLMLSLRNYLVTEYVDAHPNIARWYPPSANILRLVVSNHNGRTPHLFAAYIRIGQVRTGVVELADWGGLFAAVDLMNGKIDRALQFEGTGFERRESHPDTGERIVGNVPHWGAILETVKEIGLYLPNLRFVGWDLIVEKTGFRFIEGNSLPGIGFIQMFHPFLADPVAAEFFKSHVKRMY